MKRRIAFVAVVVVAGTAIWLSGLPASIGLGQTPAAELVKRRGAQLPQAVAIEPYGLAARVPTGWSCQQRLDTSCSSQNVTIDWKIEHDERIGSIKDIPHSDTAEGVSEIHEYVLSIELAGFRGYVSSWFGTRSGMKGCTFRGWRNDDGRGILRLQIDADLGCTPEVMDVIASTTGPEHLPTWPDDATRKRQAPLTQAMVDLADDQKHPYEWSSAFQKLNEKGASELVGPMRERANPSVTQLVEQRIRAASQGKAEDVEYAVAMAHALEMWEPAAFPRALDELAKRASERATAVHSESTLEANRLRGVDCSLSNEQARRRNDPASLRALVERTSSLDVGTLTQSFGCANVLFDNRQLAESRALLEKRYAPENVPSDVDYFDLASFTVPRVAESRLMKRHVLAMLAQKKLAGVKLVVKGRGFTLTSKLRGGYYSETVGKGVPSEGTQIALRVCDVYAHVAEAISAYRPEKERDSGIAYRIAILKKLPEKAP